MSIFHKSYKFGSVNNSSRNPYNNLRDSSQTSETWGTVSYNSANDFSDDTPDSFVAEAGDLDSIDFNNTTISTINDFDFSISAMDVTSDRSGYNYLQNKKLSKNFR